MPEIIEGDARNLNSHIPHHTEIACTITSPPYHDVLTYGHEDEVGSGDESFDAYLESLRCIFSQVYDRTAQSGSLWVVVNKYRRDGSLQFLPADLWDLLTEIGWVGKEVIIWQKDKGRPWSNGDSLRRIHEYVLGFSKTEEASGLNVDNLREPHSFSARWLSGWPERYSLEGKKPTDLWEIGIPIQGSWTGNSSADRRHLCPFPVELVARLIQMSSRRGETVLDPFSGSGVVPWVADLLDREGVGVEIVPDFVEMSKDLGDTFREELDSYWRKVELRTAERQLERLELMRLRLLKLGKKIAGRWDGHGLAGILLQEQTDVFAQPRRVPVEVVFIFESDADDRASAIERVIPGDFLNRSSLDATFKIASREWLESLDREDLWVAKGKTQVRLLGEDILERPEEPLVLTPFRVDRYGWEEPPFERALDRFRRELVLSALDETGDLLSARSHLGLSLERIYDILEQSGEDPEDIFGDLEEVKAVAQVD